MENRTYEIGMYVLDMKELEFRYRFVREECSLHVLPLFFNGCNLQYWQELRTSQYGLRAKKKSKLQTLNVWLTL